MALIINSASNSILPERCPWNKVGFCEHPLRVAMLRQLICAYKRSKQIYIMPPANCPLYNNPLECDMVYLKQGE